MKYSVIGIMSGNVGYVWHDVKTWISEALEKGNATIDADYVYDRLSDAYMQMWVVVDEQGDPVAAYVTQIDDGPVAKTCDVVALGGNGVDGWLDRVITSLELFAEYNGCTYLSMEGRRGWLKKLGKYNWSECSVRMVKEIG